MDSQGHGEIVAILVLVGLVLALGAWIAAALRRFPFTTGQSVLYFVTLLLTRVLWRTTIVGQWAVPAGKGAVIVCNHRSSIDPFFIQLLPRRAVHWMVAAEYFDLPLVGGLLRYTQSIPTRRSGVDTAATRQAIRYAQAGQLIGMLPEGRINDTDALLLPGRPGPLMVALRGRVPIVPCYIEGAPYDGTEWGAFVMPARVRLVVGEPIDLSPYYDREPAGELLGELTLKVMREIARLAGAADFQPTLAGRRWKPGMELSEGS